MEILLGAWVSATLYLLSMVVTCPMPLFPSGRIGPGTRPALNMLSSVTVAPNVFMLELKFVMFRGMAMTCTSVVS